MKAVEILNGCLHESYIGDLGLCPGTAWFPKLSLLQTQAQSREQPLNPTG